MPVRPRSTASTVIATERAGEPVLLGSIRERAVGGVVPGEWRSQSVAGDRATPGGEQTPEGVRMAAKALLPETTWPWETARL